MVNDGGDCGNGPRRGGVRCDGGAHLPQGQHRKAQPRKRSTSSISWICREFPGLPYSGIFTKDFNRIVNDPQVKIVVEVMGGLEPAYTYVKACLEHGKSVVTSNKELVAQKGAELLALARKTI